jgi:aspartyl-tRNA(Asn)/glutamyl-tRNA(Gln) amidotransferase subunit C
MRLSIDEVRHIAQLARLDLHEKEIENYEAELSAILSFVEKIQSVDTIGVAPTAYITETMDELRSDVVVHADLKERSALIGSFPSVKADLLVVPPVFLEYKE